MIHPKRILAILGIAVLLLFGVVLVFPNGEIRITDSFTIRFFSLNDLVHPGREESVDISDILESQGMDTAVALIDTTRIGDSLNIDVKEITLVKNRITYGEGTNPLSSFFAALDAVRNQHTHLRILHYGDSQLEGDRISSVIRQKFQTNEQFGGCGPGFIPVRGLIQGRLGFKQAHSGNWKEYSVWSPKKSPHRQFGLAGEYFMFTPHPEKTLKAEVDTVSSDTTAAAQDTTAHSKKRAWFKITRYGAGAPMLQLARQARVLINAHGEPYELLVSVNGGDTIRQEVKGSGLAMKDFSIDGGFQGIHVEVRAAQSPEVYGVCLDCETGISVDNVAVRSAGMMNFSQMEVAALARQVRDLNVQLVILQFGINVVKNLSSSYKGYEENIYNNIMALKAAVPDASVLVVSLSDMARKEGTGMASYPNIAMIRDAQRNAAYRSGSAFWDLYEAMGGKNSMISWVNNNPPQAEKDYTHFNPAGARVVGKMIYDALMEEYYRHKGVIVEK
jgi:lysophospholipase L1-like esterase